VVWLASDAAAGVTGQCIAAGGDRLAIWSHPVEVVSVLKDGGWDADGIADLLPAVLREHSQEFRPAPLQIPAAEGNTP
jgi:3-oxoacyl-[acyl-carrier protein] reductase